MALLQHQAKEKAKNTVLATQIGLLFLYQLPNAREMRRKDVYNMPFKVIETQAELDAIIKARLDREKESYKAKLADYEQLKKQVANLQEQNTNYQAALEEAKTQATTSEQSIADLQAKVTGYEQAQLRTKIALQNGLPYDLADRLAGETEADLKADAERLASYLAPQGNPAPLKSVEPPVNTKNAAYQSMLQGLNRED